MLHPDLKVKGQLSIIAINIMISSKTLSRGVCVEQVKGLVKAPNALVVCSVESSHVRQTIIPRTAGFSLTFILFKVLIASS